MMTSAAGNFSSLCISTGMPLPLSIIVAEPSLLMINSIESQYPPRASSIELSKTS